MCKVASRLTLLLLALVLLPSIAFAQASITGVVKDTSGGILPGVTVEASSPALIEKVRGAVTDSGGLYRIVDLRPGTYTVTFALPGFASVKREGIELTGSFTASINAELKVGALAETITVTGETPVVDVENVQRQTVLSADVVAALPATRSYGAMLNAMPGVTVDSNGLAATPTMTFFSAHGGPSNEGRMTINGMGVAAAMNGAGVSTLAYDTSNVEEMSVLLSGGLGESETGGPVMNVVPRSGGNLFAGQAFFNTAGDWSRGDNIDDALRSIGITRGPGIISSYDASGSLGGPIKRDRLWFFGSYRKYLTASGVTGVSANAYALDATHWDYLADDSIEPRNTEGRPDWSARFTGQLTTKNRITFSQENQTRCQGSTLTLSGQGCRNRTADWIALGLTNTSPEANNGYHDFPYYVTQATWSSPVTSRVLLEAGLSRFAFRSGRGPGQVPPDGNMNLIPVTEQSAIANHIANFIYRGIETYQATTANPNNWRASISYVTGTHSLKIGYQGAYQRDDNTVVADNQQLAYRFRNGVPNQFVYRLQDWAAGNRTATTSLFGQDTWTHGKLSLQGALRYDRASSFSPASGNGTTVTTRFNAAPIQFDRTDSVAAYNDISPRVGVAYDLFGNGKTAVKFNLGRYLAAATNDSIYVQNNPANRIVTSVARSWQDNGNFVVDCDILNPAAQSTPGGDTCGALTGDQLNFGQSGSNLTQVNADVLRGWGVRPDNWQWGLDVQQELVPRVSLDASYNRRWWGNFTVTDNQAVAPSDYQAWTLQAPVDPRLPGGGGYPVTIYTQTAAAAGRASKNYVTFETDFGPGRINYWQGVDLTLNARLRSGLTLQGGTSTGRTITDTCATSLSIDSPDPRNCRSQEPYQTTLRGLASYTLPRVGVLISATIRSEAPLQLTAANYVVPNTLVQSLLGRLPPGALASGTTSVALLDNGNDRLYADNRRTQLDMRFAKILRLGRTRTDVGVDLYNLLNSNYATAYQSDYSFTQPNGGTWQQPTSILAPRFARLNVTVSY